MTYVWELDSVYEYYREKRNKKLFINIGAKEIPRNNTSTENVSARLTLTRKIVPIMGRDLKMLFIRTSISYPVID